MDTTRMQELVDGAEMTIEEARAIVRMGADEKEALHQALRLLPYQYAAVYRRAAYLTYPTESAAELRAANMWEQDARQWEQSRRRQWERG